MDKVRKNPKNTGADVSVTDPTQNAGANATPLNQALANLHEAAVAGGEHFAADAPNTGVTVGGLASGTDISGQSAKEVLESILYPEYAPRWTDASIGTFSAVAGALLETGSTVPTTALANFSITTSAASAIGGSNSASGGAATNTITCDAAETGVAKTTYGAVVYTLTSAFAAGNTVVKTSKGNPTNKTAANTTTLLSAAGANASIDATSKMIKAITKTATAIINFVDAYYANGVRIALDSNGKPTVSQPSAGNAAIGTMAKLALTNDTSIAICFPPESSSQKAAFSIPASYRLSDVKEFNEIAGDFLNKGASAFTAVSETRTLADGSTKAYTKYTYNGTLSGKATYKFIFTKA